MRLVGSHLMTEFRTLARAARVILVVSIACVFLMIVAPSAFILLALLVSEETGVGALSIFILTFLALVLIALVVTACPTSARMRQL